VEGVKVSPQVIVFSFIGETTHLVARGVGSGVLITAHTHDGGHQASVNVSVNP